MRILSGLLILAALAAADTVEIRSSLDGAAQPAIVDLPRAGAAPAPLLVHLHSWSTRFDTSNNFDEIRAEAKQRGWAFVSPDFRGVNDHPEACGSDQAVQDVLDAVEWVQQRAAIDPRRIYLAGSSGGGYMALMMAGRAPRVWAAVSAFVPITDLAAWHAFSKEKDTRYWKMMESCFGFAPTHGMALQQYRRRSPVHFLRLIRGVLPVDIETGIQDGHTGAVPVSHTLRAFNELAAPADRIAETDIESITRTAAIPAHLAAKVDEPRLKKVLLRRTSNAARVTVFDGGHEADFPAAVRWLEQYRQPETAILTDLQDDQLLPRDSSGTATVPAPAVRGAGRVQVRVNGGPWRSAMPKLPAGGPYAIEFRLGAISVRRAGILVGDLYLLAGQSNMVGRAPLENPAPPDPRVHMLTPEDTWTVARDPVHEALPRDGRVVGIGLGLPFAKEMVRRTGVPIGLVPCAVGGTSLAQWSPELNKTEFRRSLYGNFLARAKMAGLAKAILWYQGEADASAMNTASTYAERFQALVRTMRADLGQPALPFYYAQLSRYVIDKGYEGWDTVREAQRLSEAALQPAGMVATIDLTLTDPIHLNRASLEIVGRRLASRILDGPAPALASAVWERPGRVRLHFTKRLQAGSGRVFGFELDRAAVLQAAQEPASGDIILTVGLVPAGEERKLYYCRGLNPVCELATGDGQALPAFGPVRLEPPPLQPR